MNVPANRSVPRVFGDVNDINCGPAAISAYLNVPIHEARESSDYWKKRKRMGVTM